MAEAKPEEVELQETGGGAAGDASTPPAKEQSAPAVHFDTPAPAAAGAAVDVPPLTPPPPPKDVRVFVSRDYSKGLYPRFTTEQMPRALNGWIELETFQKAIEEINKAYDGAEDYGAKVYCMNCLNLLSGTLIQTCIGNPYEQAVARAEEVAAKVDEEIFRPRGLMLIPPNKRGLRVLEICSLPSSA